MELNVHFVRIVFYIMRHLKYVKINVWRWILMEKESDIILQLI
jgi:hypothetical protein